MVRISNPFSNILLIKNIEQRSLKIIGNSNLKLPSAENLTKRKSSQFALDCLQIVFASPLRSLHPKNTRNNGLSVKLPKVRLEFGNKSFHYQGAKIFNELPNRRIRLTHVRVLRDLNWVQQQPKQVRTY